MVDVDGSCTEDVVVDGDDVMLVDTSLSSFVVTDSSGGTICGTSEAMAAVRG